jgi:hypothetical protein
MNTTDPQSPVQSAASSVTVSRSGVPHYWDLMTRNITLIILISYVVLLAGFTFMTGWKGDADKDGKWFDLTRNGFTTLGSALTLILGYYFGQKQVTQELKREQEGTIAELNKAEDGKEQAVERVRGLVGLLQVQPQTPSQPDSLKDADKSRLPKRPPKK